MGSLQHLYEVTEKLDNLTLFCLFVNYEPVNFQKVVQDEKLRKVMDEEIKSIVKNDTWELTTLPKCHKAIGVKWVYKMKKNTKGEIENYKARLVAKNYRLNVGIDYDEVFASVARIGNYKTNHFISSLKEVEDFQNRCEVCFLEQIP